jgi:4-amino-4-deoxy-L-arabinose transferase-like glycosyltransferase
MSINERKHLILNTDKKILLPADRISDRFMPAVTLAILTLVSRILFHGSVYFIDGPAHIRAILEKVYIIEPPGYWLFNRIAGIFPEPIMTISTMNILFSVAGVVVFYYTALYFTGRRSAFLAALAYSSVFYIWFSGEIHSTYASQALFPVATFCALLRYERDKSNWFLWLAAILFAVGAGLRPSDGVFLIPMLVYYSSTRLPRKKAALFLALILALCLTWVISTGLAYSKLQVGMHGAIDYAHQVMRVRSITAGTNAGSMANIIRYFLPLFVAFWPVLTITIMSLIRNWEDWRTRMMLFWIVPGSLFFILSYIGVAPYLTYLSAAVLLLAVSAPRMMIVTAVWNSVLFLSLSPIPSQRLIVNIWNCYAVEFTRYGIQHQWQPNLSELQTGVKRQQLWTSGP